jgi:D-alanyl-D-alanine dipeptidase
MRRALALLLCACEAADPSAASDRRTDPTIAPIADVPPVLQDSPPSIVDTAPPPSATAGSDGPLAVAEVPLSPVPVDSQPVPSASPPPGFVDLRVALPDACFTAGYAAADNFTGAPLPGYGAAGAWLLAGAADALARAQAELRADDLSLQIFDAYRPRRASEAMVAWAERTGRSQLLADGYIARRSGHNHGHTVDLGLARRGTCEPLDMGTAWDTLDARSHTANATGQARNNRLRLLAVMRAVGFHAYPKEWWHFSLPLPDTRPRDVPYGPHEPPEARERD